MTDQTPRENPPATEASMEATSQSLDAARRIKQFETKVGRVMNAGETQRIAEEREEKRQAANMALEQLRASTGKGLAMGERQAERGEHSEQFRELIKTNLETIRQTKEREALVKDFGETFAEELKKAHPDLLTNKEREALKQLVQEIGEPRKVGILPFIETFKRRARELEKPEEPPKAPTVSGTQTRIPGTAPPTQPVPEGITPPEALPAFPEKSPQPETLPETARSEKELREELFLHENIALEMRGVVEKGRKAKEKLVLSKIDLDEYFLVLDADSIRSYPSDSKEVARRLDLDSKLFLDMFGRRIQLLASEKLPEEIKKRIFENQRVKEFEEFYLKITDKNDRLRYREILDILRGQVADIIEKKETSVAQRITETLRRQLELTEEYMKRRKIQLRQGEINQILGGVFSEREREPFKIQERSAYETAERLAEELPEDIRSKKPDDFFGGLRRRGLQIKKALRSRLR